MNLMTARAPLHPLPRIRQSGSDFWLGIWLFVVGASVVVDIPIMGRVMGPDFLCTLGLVALLARQGVQNFGKEAKLFFAMLGLWLFGAVITDLIRGTDVEDIVRGWSKIVFFGIAFAYVYLATKGKLFLIALFLLGLSIGTLVSFMATSSEQFIEEPWKFGFGPMITAVVLTCISTPSFRQIAGSWVQIAVMVALAALNLVQNSRSIFAVLFAAAAVVAVGEFFRVLLKGRPVPKSLFAVTLLGGVLLYQGIVTVYSTAAASGMLGVEALEKYEWQTQGGLGLLLGGRAESLVSTQAIADSPIIGHGSWAKDYEYVMLYVQALEQRGAQIVGDPFKNALIPSHSYLFGSWVEAGILGGLFWIYILAVCGRSLYSLLHIPPWSRPLVSFITLYLIWGVFFSPFGAQERYFVPAALCMVFWAIRNELTKTSFRRRMAGAAT